MMSFRSFCRLFLLSALLGFPLYTFAAPPDVPPASWYAATVSAFVQAGYIDGSVPLHPGQDVTRGEFVSMVASLHETGGIVPPAMSLQNFFDVPPSHPQYAAFAVAAKHDWIRGAHNCIGTHNCNAKPEGIINRAEAAAILVRAFTLHTYDFSPAFSDNPASAWYADTIGIVASRCVLRGDGNGGRVHPDRTLNRVEMLTMLERLRQGLAYPHCTLDTYIPLPLSAALRTTVGSSTSSAASHAAASSTATSGYVSGARGSSGLPLPVLVAPPALPAQPTSDSTYAMLLSKYNAYILQFPGLLASIGTYDSQTGFAMLQILRKQLDLLTNLYLSLITAQKRPLNDDEKHVALSTVAAINSSLAEFSTMGKAALTGSEQP